MNQEFSGKGDFDLLKLPWWERVLLNFFPFLTLKLMAKKIKINNLVFDKLHEVFDKTKRIDIFPYCDNERGFILVLDQETALYFNQDGNSFKYDGFEMGKYNQGDITIFDHLKFKKNPYLYFSNGMRVVKDLNEVELSSTK